MTHYFKVDLSAIGSEEDVRTKVILPLLRNVGIIKSDADYLQQVPVKITAGRETKNKFADIVVYRNGKPFVVVEAKDKGVKLDDDGIAQLDSYAIWLQAPYGIACNGVELVVRGYLHGNQRVFLIKKALDKLDIGLINEAISDDANNIGGG